MKKIFLTFFLIFTLSFSMYSTTTRYVYPGTAKETFMFYLDTLNVTPVALSGGRLYCLFGNKGITIESLEINNVIVEFDEDEKISQISYHLTSYENYYYLDFYEVILKTMQKENLILRIEIKNGVVNYIGENEKYIFTFHESKLTDFYFYYVDIVCK